MEAAFLAYVNEFVPSVVQGEIAAKRSEVGTLEISGCLDVHEATRFNIAVHRFLQEKASQFGLTGKTNRKDLEIFVPQVRLGDVTTDEERRVLAAHCGDSYIDPNNMVDIPEWNVDFVRASDRRQQYHIKPRYGADDSSTVDMVAAFIVDCSRSGGLVVHTGAGISAAAGIATYREGCNETVAISAAMPTYSHYALVGLVKAGWVDYVVSQNVDGLHRRSGITADKLSELHGNSYIETCSCCTPPMEFIRPFDVYSTQRQNPKFWARYVRDSSGARKITANTQLTENERSSGIHHITGSACPCGGGPLRDSIIHFGENLPVAALAMAKKRSQNASLNLVVGSSLLVQPASGLPFAGSGPVAIVSMSCTGSDVKTLRRGGVLVRAPADAVLQRIMYHSGLDFPNSKQIMSKLALRVKERDEAVLKSNGNVPYDGGADGGVVPDELVQRRCSQLMPRPMSHKENTALRLYQTHADDGKEGWHVWSLSLQALDGSNPAGVQEVDFELHPTFNPPIYKVHQAPFEVGPFTGWGTFDVKVNVHLHSGRIMSATFPLSFQSPENILPLTAAA